MDQYICNKAGKRNDLCVRCPHSTPHEKVKVEAGTFCDTEDECWGYNEKREYQCMLVKCRPVRTKKPTMTPERELQIYRGLLIKLHTANWTGNAQKVQKIMKAISDYSYARTNTNPGNEKQEEKSRIQTILNLEKL